MRKLLTAALAAAAMGATMLGLATATATTANAATTVNTLAAPAAPACTGTANGGCWGPAFPCCDTGTASDPAALPALPVPPCLNTSLSGAGAASGSAVISNLPNLDLSAALGLTTVVTTGPDCIL